MTTEGFLRSCSILRSDVMKMRLSLLVLVVCAGCGTQRNGASDAGNADTADATRDSGTTELDIGAVSDQGGLPDTSTNDGGTQMEVDAGSDAAGDGGADVGPDLPEGERCHSGNDDDGDGLADCDDPDCFSDTECGLMDLSDVGVSGFTPCGTPIEFTADQSRQVCESGPGIVPDWSGEFDCDEVDFEGKLTFLCGPPPNPGSNDTVYIRYDVTATPVGNGTYEMLGQMSFTASGETYTRESRGDNHTRVVGDGAPTWRIVGNHWVGNIQDGSADTYFWFDTGQGAADFGGGGFHVPIDMAQLRQ
jgi:hypothetical protein